MRKLVIAALMLTGLAAVPRELSFPTADGGVIRADLYGTGDRGVVLAHGARFEALYRAFSVNICLLGVTFLHILQIPRNPVKDTRL